MEKTFEELAREKVVKVMGFNVLTENEVIEIIQQVREATITECAEICGTLWRIDLAEKSIKQLPTDRIKTP